MREHLQTPDRILIVDDEPPAVMNLAHVCRKEGYEVTTRTSGAGARVAGAVGGDRGRADVLVPLAVAGTLLLLGMGLLGGGVTATRRRLRK